MIKKNIAIIGLGNIGQAVLANLAKSISLIKKRSFLQLNVVKVCDIRKSKQKIARRYKIGFTTSVAEIINDPQIDIVVELIGGVKPAKDYIISAIKNKKQVVTANKALLASHGKTIFELAAKNKVNIGFEASVCGAVPVIKVISESLVSCNIHKIYGILNGTTNYVLSQMGKERKSFSEALLKAQKKGFAEKNPSFDIKGIDSLHKLVILSYLCFGVWPSVNKVYTEGITGLSLEDILYAQELGYAIKLLSILKKDKEGLDLRVHPALVPISHPLAKVDDQFNSVYMETSPAGKLLLYGEGAGPATASAVISDLVNVSKDKSQRPLANQKINLKNIKDISSRYYIRFNAKDKPGVLAGISRILSSYNISISSVTQKERSRGRFVPIVMLTHEAKEEAMRQALVKIDRLSLIKAPSRLIRIEKL